MSLLAGACLAAASCSDSDKEIKAPSPNFPEAVSPTIGAGETFTIEIDPNQDWEASVPTATAAWFWIEDGTQKVWTLRGGAGPARIVIAAAELEEFDDNRVCEVTLTMGGQSKVIATITRGTLDRGFTLRTCQLDDYGRLHLQPQQHRNRAYLPLRHRTGRKRRPDVARRPHRIFDAGTRGGQLRMGARQTAGVA